MSNKFSYSSISVYEQCPYKYKLVYLDKHFIDQSTIATEFGTLIHHIEETIANLIKENKPIDYDTLIDMLYNIEEPKKKLFGINLIKKKYPQDFYEVDKSNRTYEEKVETYVNNGIYRLEKYIKANPDLEIVAAEYPFDWEYRGYIFHGFIDRIFYDRGTNKYIVEDIKTYSIPLDDKALTTPLQFVIYNKAMQVLFDLDASEIECAYDLPLCDCKQPAGGKGFVKRGFKHIDKLLDAIEAKDFHPEPSALCHWCVFSKTYPEQPDAAKNLCPYFSHWTKKHKTLEVEYEWMGESNHEKILAAFIESQNRYCIVKCPEMKIPDMDKKEDLVSSRRLLVRR